MWRARVELDPDAGAAGSVGAMAGVERSERALRFSDRAVEEENPLESRIVRAHIADRRAAVDVGSVNLCFGRIDLPTRLPAGAPRGRCVGDRGDDTPTLRQACRPTPPPLADLMRSSVTNP